MGLIIDFSVISILITGIWQFREPRGARFGNLTAAAALTSAFVLVLLRHGVIDPATVALCLVAGAIIGTAVARAVDMIQIPAMVAFQHGAGGVAAFLVSFVELTRHSPPLDRVSTLSGVLGLTVSALTFSASMLASAKLAGKLRQTPQRLPRHNEWLMVNVAVIILLGVMTFLAPPDTRTSLYLMLIAASAAFGLLFSIRIGGADMPVLISFLNATAGMAAALCGMTIGNQLLIAFGAFVAASGSILTHVMCKAMNRSLVRVFVPLDREGAPRQGGAAARATAEGAGSVDARLSIQRLAASLPDGRPQPAADPAARDRMADAAEALAGARTVIVIPGYGMALAKAQFKVVELATLLTRRGALVKYAIHPVAGRMPGHMNVILAEAEVDYDDLLEMDEVNAMFKDTDVALVIGACDVVNPAAIEEEGTPISGMPIIKAHEAKAIVVCNVDTAPGYSGVSNPLYDNPNAILLEGDAKASIGELIGRLSPGD